MVGARAVRQLVGLCLSPRVQDVVLADCRSRIENSGSCEHWALDSASSGAANVDSATAGTENVGVPRPLANVRVPSPTLR